MLHYFTVQNVAMCYILKLFDRLHIFINIERNKLIKRFKNISKTVFLLT